MRSLWRGSLLPPRFRRPWQIALSLILIGVLVRSLPLLAPVRVTDLVQDQQAVEFRDRNGLALGTLLTRDQDHTVGVPLPQVSPLFVQAILAAEDGRFYRHGALEGRAIARSVLEAIRVGEFRSGASTITMQLARMLHPVRSNLPGKLQEIWLSWRLVAGMTKDQILEAYINRLPMGGNIYGVEAAAQVYFGIPATDLNLAQASLLAALPNDPTYLNPYHHWDDLKERQVYVLRRMVADGYITQAESDRANAEPVTFYPPNRGIVAAPHFLFWLAQDLPPDHPAQIRTSLDRPLQQFVEAQVQQTVKSLAAHNGQHAAALVIENSTGEVLAYVGSPDYFDPTQAGRNDGVQALRQPGSTLKPFLYQLALEQRRIRPNTVLADVPTRYAIPGARLYSPTDYSETFQGPVRVRVALANSLNIPAVRVLEQVGVQNFLHHLRQLGFVHLTQPPEYYGLGLTLGSGEVTLWELAQAYVTLARQGNPMALTGYPREYGQEAKATPLGSATTWALITEMLSDRHARAKAFGVESVLNLPFATAVKTGTSSDFRDTWTVGFSSDYTVAAWVGNFSGEPMRQVSGVMGAAPLWQRIMLHLHERQEPAGFPTPPGLVQRPVCALSGLKPTPACPAVVQEYFYPQDLPEYERQLDTFYQATSVDATGQAQTQLTLPPEYKEWLARQEQPRLNPQALSIVSPRPGDLYWVYPTGSPDTPGEQRLEFKLATTPSQPVEWWLNGQKLSTQTTPSVFWTLQAGTWTLVAKSGDWSDQVQFQVEQASPRTTRRGFSIAPPRGNP